MVTLYTSPSCTSCRKAKAWLEENDIEYTERNIFSEPLSLEEIKEILRMTEDGTEDRKSTRLNSSHVAISYAVFCLKKKTITTSKNTETNKEQVRRRTKHT